MQCSCRADRLGDRSLVGSPELVERARARIAIRPPAAELGGMAEAVAVELRVRDLADALRRHGNPVALHVGRPAPRRPLEPPERAAADQEALLPRVALERDDQRAQLLEQLVAALARERRRYPDVLEPSLVVVQAEQQ